MTDEDFLHKFTDEGQGLVEIRAKEREEGRHDYMPAANRMICGHR